MSLRLPVISTSLDPASKSRVLASQVAGALEAKGHDAPLIDLSLENLPAFDNSEIFDSRRFRELYDLIGAADGIVLASPIYNWGIGSNARNLVEATGATGEGGRTSAWFDKVVTFVCSAGLPHSYMGYMQLAGSMMLDFKCVVNPYVLYVTDRDWQAGEQLTAGLQARLEKTVDVHIELSDLLRGRSYASGWEV